jgi:MFS transporter, ACS family, glucarate transporter
MPTAHPRPTRIRYAIVLVAMLAAVLLYLERACLGIAEVFIREDLSITTASMGWVLSAFYFAYAIGQVPAGWLSQRYGPRLMMTLYMLGLALFGLCIAVSQDFITLFASRFLLGLAQAGAYPTAALMVKRWIPDKDRGFASSVVSFGGRFGGAAANWLTGLLIILFVPLGTSTAVTAEQVLDATPVLSPDKDQQKEQDKTPALDAVREKVRGALAGVPTGDVVGVLNRWIATPGAFDGTDWANVPLPQDVKRIAATPTADRTAEESARLNRLVLEKAFPGAVRQLFTDGWRPTMYVYAGFGVLMALAFWLLARDRPTEHPWCNDGEKAFIVNGQSAASQNAGTDAVPWKELIRSRNQWLFSAFQLFTNLGWIFLMTYSARYLYQRFGTPLDERALMTTVPLFAAAFGMLFGGWLTDRLARSVGVRWGRAIPGGLFKIPCVIAMAACPFLPSAWAVVIALTIMSFCTDVGVPSAWAFAQDTGGRQSATVLGWGNMWGNLGAAAGAKLLDELSHPSVWGLDGMMYFCAAAFALSGVAALLANAAEPLFKDAD